MSGFDNEVVYARGMRLQASTAQDILLMQATATDVSRINFVGDPNGSVAANPSSLCHDPVSGNVYYKQTGTGNTGWVQIEATTTDLHWPKFVVGDTTNGANYSTIAAALTAASSGDTIALQPGTYTENITLKAGVNIVGLNSDPYNPNVSIVGKMSYSGAGTVSISGVRLTTNSDYFLEVTGSSASIVYLTNCYLNCVNNTGINYTSSSSSSLINIYYCIYKITLAATTLFTSTSAGGMLVYHTSPEAGNSQTASSVNGTNIFVNFCKFSFPLSVTAASCFIYNSEISTTNQNLTCLTTVTSGSTAIRNSSLGSGTASAISIGAGTTVTVGLVSLDSSNANVVTGAGTFNYTNIAFPNSSTTGMNVTTQTASTGGVGKLRFFQTTGTTGTSVSNIMNYYEEGTFTPTVDGAVSGTTTYTAQNGYYTRIGNMVFVQATVSLSAMTGTGSCVLGGLPFTVKNQTNGNATGSVTMNNAAAWTWGAGTTSATLLFVNNAATARVVTFGSGVGQATLQCANASASFNFSGCYQV